MAGSICSIPADESVLLMHFLDIVFLLECPMYKPGILEGGRGWLLAPLLRTKPLYHAALALSAYYRRTIILAKISRSCRVAALVQQEKHLEICLKLVNQFAQNSCPKMGLGVTTSVVQLVFFEVLFYLENL
jgi:C6 transcription factor Pro1